MNLVRGEEMAGLDAHRRRHPPAVFRDVVLVVLRADAAVQAGIDSTGDAALAAEKSVAQRGYGGQQWGRQHHRFRASAARSSSSLSATSMSIAGSEIPITLNSDPM